VLGNNQPVCPKGDELPDGPKAPMPYTAPHRVHHPGTGKLTIPQPVLPSNHHGADEERTDVLIKEQTVTVTGTVQTPRPRPPRTARCTDPSRDQAGTPS